LTDAQGSFAPVRERLEELAGADLSDFFAQAFEENAAPEAALANLERFLAATANPRLHLQQIAGLPQLGRLLMALFGASQPLADSLIQNPELASLVLEPRQLGDPPDRAMIEREGRKLLEKSTSPRHRLDRLRYLKQRWNLQIALADLSSQWPQEAVWQALSDLADALILLARESLWPQFSTAGCPVSIVAFGKLGGRELNYSSDVDLAYVLEDDAGEAAEREATRFCEALGRALSEKMGRGAVYRVDLRLRPYGGAGPILRSFRSFESYYALYAEPWEVQALLKSRVVVGPEGAEERWDALVRERCYRPQLGQPALEAMLEMRGRIEEAASDEDLKRGAGGIRDVEFLVQLLQMMHGHERPRLRVRATADALRALEEEGVLGHAVAAPLLDGYTFLRKLEHRCQLAGDRQTHSLPVAPGALEGIAKLMGEPDWPALSARLAAHRRTIHTLYRSMLTPEQGQNRDRDSVLERLGVHAPAAAAWFDGLPESDAFYRNLRENEGSLGRVERILEFAPRLVAYLKASVPLTELVMSGEIEEAFEPEQRMEALAPGAPPREVAAAYTHSWAHLLAAWALAPAPGLEASLAHLMDGLVRHVAGRLGASFDVLALGSYGMREFGAGSDADFLFLVENAGAQPVAESEAQNLLAFFGQLKRAGAPVEVDLRLRPEGRSGLLVRTYAGFRAYDFEGMEVWERFALGAARLVLGPEEALRVAQHSAYAIPLTPERLRELARMKRRIETERVQPQHLRRNVKLGAGGLNDIEWLVHLHEMRYPTATRAGEAVSLEERIRAVGRASLLNAVETEVLLDAHRRLLDARAWIYLLGYEPDLVPENPDKLDRLGRAAGYGSGNEFLARHEKTIDQVRRLYEEGLERLRA
jgi:[glutamine synthetase] adenylyltransferase / [glutamine synthetase]-adenylyl-L-tyrosine phosphorylase